MFSDDKPHGQGIFYGFDGYKIEIDWQDGEEGEGQGEMTYSNGEKYVGQIMNHKKQGKGTYTYSNGDTYEGEWDDDLRHGHGILKMKNRADGIYEAAWYKDKKQGHGVHNQPNGKKYDGQWENDKK
jgi:hypothetical protein